MSGQDAEIADLRAKLAEAERQRDDARAEAREHNESHVTVADLLTVAQSRAERAEAACAEMRAALEPFAIFCAAFDGKHSNLARKADDPIYCFNDVAITLGMVRTARALLARTDLGRGMVAVERAAFQRVRNELHEWMRGDPDYEEALSDLDALLDGGKVKP